ncbi:hypothetical protein [Thermomonas sp.]|uniref:hypothetical protein n=1 Tax=Thermomonas sp. TaxID=1971895 RepID=UPI0035AE8B41
MSTTDLLAAQVKQALAQGDKAQALRLLREAGMPALRRAVQEAQAQAAVARHDGEARVSRALANAAEQARQQAPHVQAGVAAWQARKRPPTVVMGDPPGSPRRVLVALALLALAAWLGLHPP